jgi:hypothetical protein
LKKKEQAFSALAAVSDALLPIITIGVIAEAGFIATKINSIVEQKMRALFNCKVFEVVSTLLSLLLVRTEYLYL